LSGNAIKGETLMRVVRTVAGLVLLTIGLPVLLVGGALWTLMQHRDAGGAFSGSLETVSTSGRAIVVPDVDTLLREDAAFVRAGDTRMRLTVPGETFLGLAPAAEVRAYLAGAAYSRVDGVTVARGDLPVRVAPVGPEGLAGPAASEVPPGTQSFWTRQGSGTLEWTANEVDGREMSLVVMRVDATPGLTVDVMASATPGWLTPATWTLVALGVLLLGAGIAALAWPVRSREVVFVVDPSQVPEVSARLSGIEGPAGPPPVWPALPAAEVAEPLPVLPGDEPRPADGSWPDWPSDSPPGRPATLADALAGAGKTVPAPPGPAWPPAQPGTSTRSPSSDSSAGAADGAPSAPNAWHRAEAARLAGLPAVTTVAAQLSVESVPTSGAPSGAATAIPTTRPIQADGDPAPRTPAPRADADVDDAQVPGVAHLRAVKTDGVERPAKRAARTATRKRPVVFVDTATEPTGESPDRPVVASRSRTKSAPQPRDAAGPQTAQPAPPTETASDDTVAGAAPPPAAKTTKRKPRRATATTTEPATTGTTTAEPSSVSAESVEGGGVAAEVSGVSSVSAESVEGGGVAAEVSEVNSTMAERADAAAKQPSEAVATVAQPADAPVAGSAAGDAAVAQPATEVGDSEAGKAAAAVVSAGPETAGVIQPKAAKSTKPRKRAATGAGAPVAADPTMTGTAESTSADTAESTSADTAEPTSAGIAESTVTGTVEPTMIGTEVIESIGSDADQGDAEHGAVSAGAPIGTGALVGTVGEPAPEAAAKPARRTTRAKKAADPEAKPAKTTRAPRRKATAPEAPAVGAGPAAQASAEATASETDAAETGSAEPGTPFGGLLGTTAPAKPRRRKTAAGLPSPEATDAGPAHTAVAALAGKRPTTRRRPTKAATTRPTDNRAAPTDQAS
jgi:hypothetical protein